MPTQLVVCPARMHLAFDAALSTALPHAKCVNVTSRLQQRQHSNDVVYKIADEHKQG